jgi:hypothetical protein
MRMDHCGTNAVPGNGGMGPKKFMGGGARRRLDCWTGRSAGFSPFMIRPAIGADQAVHIGNAVAVADQPASPQEHRPLTNNLAPLGCAARGQLRTWVALRRSPRCRRNTSYQRSSSQSSRSTPWGAMEGHYVRRRARASPVARPRRGDLLESATKRRAHNILPRRLASDNRASAIRQTARYRNGSSSSMKPSLMASLVAGSGPRPSEKGALLHASSVNYACETVVSLDTPRVLAPRSTIF